MISGNILDLVGNTPLLRLNRIGKETGAEILVKVERMNPTGSIKDRFALAAIEEAEKEGLLKPGSTIVEATSGNTGIALSMIAAVKGYKLIIFMPESMSQERMQMMKAFGAELMLTPARDGVAGAVVAAEEFAKKHHDVIVPKQFENEINPITHERVTAREILDEVHGGIDAVVAGVGTGGTLIGVSNGLRVENPDLLTVAVWPSSDEKEHSIQGIGDGLIPKIVEGKRIDREVHVTSADAIDMANQLARKEGLLAGVSSGANVFAAVQIAKELGPGKRILTIAPDNGERYLSMNVFG